MLNHKSLSANAERPGKARDSGNVWPKRALLAPSVYDALSALPAEQASCDLIEGFGGVRKLRWARDGRGKSGGVRVIYYFHSEAMPLYLLTMFAKNERANLSKAERNALAGLVDALVHIWLER